MLSEFIRSVHSYSALPLAGTADRPEVRSTRSSRTKVKSPQNSTPAVDRRPTCLTHVIIDYSTHWTIASSVKNRLLMFSLSGQLNKFNLPSVLSLFRIPPILINLIIVHFNIRDRRDVIGQLFYLYSK